MASEPVTKEQVLERLIQLDMEAVKFLHEVVTLKGEDGQRAASMDRQRNAVDSAYTQQRIDAAKFILEQTPALMAALKSRGGIGGV